MFQKCKDASGYATDPAVHPLRIFRFTVKKALYERGALTKLSKILS